MAMDSTKPKRGTMMNPAPICCPQEAKYRINTISTNTETCNYEIEMFRNPLIENSYLSVFKPV